MDRLLGLLTILFLAAASCAPFQAANAFGHISPYRTHRTGPNGCGGCIRRALFLACQIRFAAPVAEIHPVSKCSNPIWKRTATILFASRATALAFFITIVSHIAYYTSFFCAGEALHAATGHAAKLSDILSIMPLVNTITSVPISLGGLGVRETLFQELLGSLIMCRPRLQLLLLRWATRTRFPGR